MSCCGRPATRTRIEAKLPIDLALKSCAEATTARRPGGAGGGQRTEMSVLEAFTNTVRGVHGTLRMDAQVLGSWDKLALAGYIDVRNAEGSVPSLGTSFATQWSRPTER